MITCFFENGSKSSLRHVVVDVIVIKNKQILLCLRGTFNGKPIPESGKWGLLGGYLNRNEKLVDGVRREVMEESGWIINNIQLFRINDNPNRPAEDKQNVALIFTADAVKKVKKSDEEVKELKWFDLDKLPPKEMIAFDHGENLQLYTDYLKIGENLPILR